MIDFIRSAMIRAVRTMAQAFLASTGYDSAMILLVGLSDVDWGRSISIAITAGIFSIIFSIATGLPEVERPVEMTDDEADDLIDDCPELLDVE